MEAREHFRTSQLLEFAAHHVMDVHCGVVDEGLEVFVVIWQLRELQVLRVRRDAQRHQHQQPRRRHGAFKGKQIKVVNLPTEVRRSGSAAVG